MDEPGAGTKTVLSQSYTQGLERISQHKAKIGHFQLPEDIIDEREKTWDNFFQKYSHEFTDEIEINLRSPSDEDEDHDGDCDEAEEEEEEEEENDDDDDDDDDDDNDDNNYYTKSKTPMRKTSSMVQYWVDTGNTPYQLMDEDVQSDTGSSLSEVESPKKFGQFFLKNIEKRPSTLNGSSVDTAAYILSNTNVTKKAETMAIVKRSRSPDGHQFIAKVHGIAVSLQSASENVGNSTASPNNSIFLNQAQDTSKILNKLEETILENSLNNSRVNSHASSKSDNCEINDIMPSSMKITDILPTLQNWDKLVDKSAVHQLHRNSELGSGDSTARCTLKSSMAKKVNKRKLYTGRDSPIDIIISSQIGSDDQIVPTGISSHPAFQVTPKIVKKVTMKKRSSLLANKNLKISKPLEINQNSKSSDSLSEEKTSSFFQFLSLAPNPRFNTRTKRKIINGAVVKKRTSGMKKANKYGRNDDGKSSKSGGRLSSSSSASRKSMKYLLALCTKKTLSVPIERLSQSVLMKLGTNNSNSKRKIPHSRRKQNETAANTAESNDSEEKQAERKLQEQIALDSQVSDHSTIIICKAQLNLNKTPALQKGSKTTCTTGSEQSEVTVKIGQAKPMNSENDREAEKQENQPTRQLRSQTMLTKMQENEKSGKCRNFKAKKINVKSVNVEDEKKEELAKSKNEEKKHGPRQEQKENNKVENVNRKPLTFGTFRSTTDTDSESSTDKALGRSQIKIRSVNPVITFSSDDDNDFIKAMEQSTNKYERKLRSKSRKSSENQSTLVDNLMDQPVALLLNTIAESEDEEIIQLSLPQVQPRTRKQADDLRRLASVAKSVEKKSPENPTRMSQTLNTINTRSFDDNASKTSDETKANPLKKLKTDNGVVKKQCIKENPSKSEESNTNDESSNESMSILLGRSTRSSGIKRKTDVEKNCAPEVKMDEIKSTPVTMSQSPATILKTKKLSMKEPKLCPETPAIPSKISSQFAELKELRVSIEKIESAFSSTKNLNFPRKSIRLSKKKSLLSEHEVSQVDFILQPINNPEKLINDDSAGGTESVKCIKLFHNPFEECGKQLSVILNRRIVHNNNHKEHCHMKATSTINNKNVKPIRTFRTRLESDSDD